MLRDLNTTRYAIDRDDGPDWMVETFDTAVPIDDGGRAANGRPRRSGARDRPPRVLDGPVQTLGSNERRNR